MAYGRVHGKAALFSSSVSSRVVMMTLAPTYNGSVSINYNANRFLLILRPNKDVSATYHTTLPARIPAINQRSLHSTPVIFLAVAAGSAVCEAKKAPGLIPGVFKG
jgi:hypothetical protein